MHSSRGSSQPRDLTQVSCIIRQFFPIWATRRPKNIGVCSLSLVQGIFLTQELNWGLLYYRQILSFAQAIFHFGLFFWLSNFRRSKPFDIFIFKCFERRIKMLFLISPFPSLYYLPNPTQVKCFMFSYNFCLLYVIHTCTHMCTHTHFCTWDYTELYSLPYFILCSLVVKSIDSRIWFSELKFQTQALWSWVNCRF